MTGTVFFETLRRSWRQMIYWGLGLFIWGVYPFVMIPDQEGLDGYAELVETMDANLLRAFGIDGAASLSTPEGFVGYAYFGYALLILAVFAVIAGLNITSSEEDSGIMDIVLALPIARWKVVIEKILAYSVMIVGITTIGFIGLLIGNQMAAADLQVDTMALLEGSFNIIPGTILILTFTAFVSTLVRRRIVATSIAGGFVALSFLLDAIGKAANSDIADSIRQVSVFAHYDGSNILLNGLAWGSILLLFVIAFLLSSGAVVLFERRDIAV